MNGKEIECPDKNMAENQAQREYYKEWFNLGLILHGELNYLEAAKQYIIEHFCYTKKVKLKAYLRWREFIAGRRVNVEKI